MNLVLGFGILAVLALYVRNSMTISETIIEHDCTCGKHDKCPTKTKIIEDNFSGEYRLEKIDHFKCDKVQKEIDDFKNSKLSKK